MSIPAIDPAPTADGARSARTRRTTEGVVLSVRDLNVKFPSENGVVHAVRGVSFDLHTGEVLGIVGESGSGKSVTSAAILGLSAPNAQITGSVLLHGDELLGRSDKYMSNIRGTEIAMVFQDPLSALTPVYTVGTQIVEAIQIHRDVPKRVAWNEAVELLDLVGIPNPAERANAFPHEFSGGMRQRAVIAIAIANNPDVIIADEPTTALDVTIQAQILDVLQTAQRETGAAVIMITHDLGVVAGMADRIQVMYAGRAIETGTVDDVYYRSRMPYTIGLLGSVPRLDAGHETALVPIEGNPPSLVNLPDQCQFAPRCPMAEARCRTGEPELVEVGAGGHRAACVRHEEIASRNLTFDDIYPIPDRVENRLARVPRDDRPEVLRVDGLRKSYRITKGAVIRRNAGRLYAVDGVSFDIREGETLGLVGESGCGKTTTLTEILELVEPEDGTITIFGKDVAGLRSKRIRKTLRRDLQVVFQDPMAALDPRMPVFDLLAEPLRAHGLSKSKISDRVFELVELVGLDRGHVNRFAQHFSGGQRQRIGIARALALEPRLIVLDEPVAALDVSIQAGVINLLDELRGKLGLSYLFVAHDLAVVRHIADRVAVMYLGKIVELGDVDSVFERPTHPYSQALLSAIPIPDPEKERSRERIVLKGDLPSPANPPSGCRFRTRCPKFLTLNEPEQARCINEEPRLDDHRVASDHVSACHFAEVKVVV